MTARWAAASAAVGLALAAVAASAVPAYAATSGRIVHQESTDGQLQVIFTAQDAPDGVTLDPASVRLTINGQPVQAEAHRVEAKDVATVTRTSVLAIDTSGSMQGAGLTGAKAAANAYLTSVPPDVQVGLVTFADTATVALAPTRDRAAVRAAVDKLQAKGNTALYDAVTLAAKTVGTTGIRNVVVLTDGRDEGSKTTLSQARAQLAKAKVTLDAVSFRTSADAKLAAASQQALTSLASSVGGRVVATGASAVLTRVFAQAAQSLSDEVVITAPVPAGEAGKQVTIQVTGTAGGAAVSDSTVLLLAAAAPTPVDPSLYGAKPVATGGFLHSKAALWVALAAVFLALALILGVALLSVRTDRRNGVRRRLSIYTLSGRVRKESQETTVLGQNAVARTVVEFANRIVVERGFEEQLARRLDAAGLPLRPAEWVLIHAGVAIGLPLLVLLLTSANLVLTLLAVLFGVMGPFAFLTIKETMRTRAFMTQLPDTLQLLAGSLSAGYSFPQAIDTVVREGTDPIAGEFNRAIVEARLGVPVEDALEHVADRMRNRDFGWVVMAVRIQREVGGNLAEVLTTVAATLRERERLRRQVQVLSAEGRLSAWILGALPVVFTLYLLLARPSYIKILFTDPIGIVMLVGGVILMTVGVFWLRKVVKVEV